MLTYLLATIVIPIDNLIPAWYRIWWPHLRHWTTATGYPCAFFFVCVCVFVTCGCDQLELLLNVGLVEAQEERVTYFI